MMKKTTTLLLLCGIACSFASFSPIHPPVRPRQKSAIHTIIIDPGHGGFDHGCKGLFSKEKDVTLAISLKLGKAIQEAYPDIKLVYTRTTDIMPGNMPTVRTGLRYRADLANKSKGDLFLCIHANATPYSAGTYAVHKVIGHKMAGKGRRRKRVPVYDTHYVKNTRVGTETLIWKAMWGEYKGSVINQNDSGEENMGDSAAESIDMTSPEARIRAQLYEKKYFANSAFFGQLVQNEFVRSGRVSEGVQQREVGVWVLEATGMPSVLVETGYLTNKEEEEYLNSDDGQAEVVRNILDALKHYKDSLEGHGDATGRRTGSLLPSHIAR
ncbi:MAG TPA: N-acetylmuramoyl-L-alanine amidase [Puia sp.]|jgi:N-acetylmuramoyl-L-alanine amidase